MLSNNTNTHNKQLNKNDLPLSQVDPKAAKQKAAEDKLQLLATIQAMQKEGKLPHNDQLNELLEKLIGNKVISSREHLVSEDGKLLLNDFRDLLQTLQKALVFKNKDELFQSLVYHLHCMDSPISKEHVSQSMKTQDKNQVQEEGKKGSEALYKILKLMLINNEFRSVLGELLDISQDIFNNVVGKIGDSLQDAGNNLQDSDNRADRSGKHLVDKTLDKAINYAENPKDRELKKNSIHDQEPHLISSPYDDPRHQGLLNTGDSVHPDAIPGAFPIDQQKENPVYQHAREHKDHIHHTVKQKIPQEKQDELIRRLQRALVEVQGHPDYQESIDTIIRLIKVWSNRLSHVSGDITNKAKENDSHEQAGYRERAEREIKAIIEIWAQDQSIDPLLKSIQQVMTDMKNDEHLRNYYHTVFNYLDRLMKEPGYISTDRSIDDGRYLMDSGHDIIKGKYGDHLNYLTAEARRYIRLIAEDEISRELAQRFSQIHRDLWMDSDGNPAFKPQLIDDMKMTLLPAFIDEIRYIPIPRIEYSDNQYDLIVENLVLSGDTLLPNLFETKIESFNSFSLKTDTPSKPSHQTLFVRMDEIQAEINDVAFSYKKKTGFPKLSDHGVASVSVGGKGINIAVRIQSVTDNPAKTFKVAYCKCNVSNIKITINDSKHDILYKTLRPLIVGQIRKQIAKGIETKLIEYINQLDQKVTKSIVDMHQQVQNKAYESLPEHEKMQTSRHRVSQARPRPSLFSALVSIVNNNIKTKVQKRNAKKRRSLASSSSSSISSSSMNTDRNHKLFSHHRHDPDSLSTDRHHFIDSPPHSPTQRKHAVHNNNDLKIASDFTNLQQGQQQDTAGFRNQI